MAMDSLTWDVDREVAVSELLVPRLRSHAPGAVSEHRSEYDRISNSARPIAFEAVRTLGNSFRFLCSANPSAVINRSLGLSD